MPKKCKKCGLLNFDGEPKCVACGSTEFVPFKPNSKPLKSEPVSASNQPDTQTNITDNASLEEVSFSQTEIKNEFPVVNHPQVKKEPIRRKPDKQDIMFENKTSNPLKLILINAGIGIITLLTVFGIVRYIVVNGMLPG